MAAYPFLSDVRVVEVAHLAPSSVGGHLADLGADVIKVETGPGDGVRRNGAWAVGDPDGEGFMHLRWNRGKRSIGLDLRSDAGRAAFLDLCREVDVVIEGTRSGYLAWLGVGPDEIAAVNPRAVFCSVSGFGTSGPLHRLGSGGPVFDAYAGLRDVVLTDEPPTAGMAGGDAPTIAMHALGAHGAMGVLAALHEARRGGIGRRIELAGVDVAATWIPDLIDPALNRDRVLRRGTWLPDGRLPDWPRLEAYRTSDGHAVLFGAHVAKFWRSFCVAVGREDLLAIDVDRVDDGASARADRLWSELRDLFATRTRTEWLQLFLDHDIAGGPVHDIDELVADPHFRARATTYPLTTPDGVELELATPALHVPGSTFSTSYPPAPGADTVDVLRDVAGYDDERLADLARSGAITPSEVPA